MKQTRHTGALVYYDGVQVLSGQDEAGGRYISVPADSLQDGARYVVFEVSLERMKRLHTGAPDLKALLVDESKGGSYLAGTANGFCDQLALQSQSVTVI